jgi:hypothetical protein
LAVALRPWERRLTLESVQRWLIRGAIAALLLASLVLAVGWVTPWPESELRPWALQAALPLLVAALLVAVFPVRRLRQAAVLDTRLGFGDRLATAWVYRESTQTIVRLQRSDAIARLEKRSPQKDLVWRPTRRETIGVAATFVVTLLLFVTPSPQQAVLDRQAAEQAAVEQTSQRLEALRQEAIAGPNLTPEQARQLDELLQAAQAELNRVHTQQDATAILARTQDQLGQQLADPNAALRDEAIAAMSETLAAEPLARPLGDALQHEDAQATSDALKQLAAQADQLSDVQRQALSRALQRASNVGRSEPRSAAALREAARAIAAGESAQQALAVTDAALRESIQAANAQTSVQQTTQRLRDISAQLAGRTPLNPDEAPPNGSTGQSFLPGLGQGELGTPVALDSTAIGGIRDPGAAPGSGAGIGAADANAARAQGATDATAAENVFVPGRAGDGAVDQSLTDQPFTVRGAPRPYRDVLNQYAQSGRDYVDRPDVSPAVRDLVKQYFQKLEEGQ